VEGLRHDLRHAARSLLRSRGLSVTAIGVLGLGTGLAMAAFSVVHALFLRPLPFRNPARLVVVEERHQQQGYAGSSYEAFDHWTNDSTAFSDTALLGTDETELGGLGSGAAGPERPEPVAVSRVTASFFPLLGVPPQVGRPFLPEDEARGDVVILSHRGWQRWFGGRENVLGQHLTLGGHVHTVVGVMPPAFQFNYGAVTDLWVPFSPASVDRQQRQHATFARLRPGVSLSEAQGQLDVLARRYAQELPGWSPSWGFRVVPMRHASDWVDRPATQALLLAFGAAMVVLLIAGANVTCLLLVRSLSRAREVAIRTAVGASRARLIRLELLESGLLCSGGVALGLLVAAGCRGAVVALVPSYLDLGASIGPLDGATLLFASAIAIVGGTLVGIVPALWTAHLGVSEVLRQESSSTSLGRRRAHLMNGLIAGEIALALGLLIHGGLFLKSLLNVMATPLGYRTENVLSLKLRLPGPPELDSDQVVALYADLTRRLEEQPGVRAAAAVESLPLSFTYSGVYVLPEGREEPQDRRSIRSLGHAVTPSYFRTLGIPLLEGRGLETRDRRGSEPVAVVSRALARRDWPGEDPLGRRIRVDDTWRTVVGIVGDVRHRGPLSERIDDDIYIPHTQRPTGSVFLVVHTSPDGPRDAASLARLVEGIDPRLQVRAADSLVASLERQTAGERSLSGWVLSFAGLALLLSATGLFGVTAHLVTQRMRELGIRMALGATQHDIARMVLGRGLRLLLLGGPIGMLLAYLVARPLASLIHGLRLADPATYAAATLAVAATALAASYLPARRAARVNPADVLRD
jgi:putative ABC transport system permease protein